MFFEVGSLSKRSKLSQVNDILNLAIEEANTSQYCLNCDFSFLREEDGGGYCKFQRDEAPYSGYLKPIQEYTSCDHWKKKNE